MNQNQCNELRDYLFAAPFPSGSKEDVFRYVAVTSTAADGAAATVHYAYAPPSWERAEQTSTPTDFLLELIANSPFAGESLQLQCHDYLRNGWPLPWGITAKASLNDFPSLILVERTDGSVTGVLMRNSHEGRAMEKIADGFVEPHEVELIICELRAMPLDQKYYAWYKDSNVDADSLADALIATSESAARQKEVMVYRGAEWLWGIWNNPEKYPDSAGLHLSSVADFHGTRVSISKLATRVGLEAVRDNQTIKGDCTVLEEALARLRPRHMEMFKGNYEQVPAVGQLCAWWNALAPEEMRYAASFRTYIWSEEGRIFSPGDPEEPALQATILASEGAYALFEQDGVPPVAIQFHRGREFNTDSNGGTQVYLANGAEGMDIGLDIGDVDEAYYAVKGLFSVQREW